LTVEDGVVGNTRARRGHGAAGARWALVAWLAATGCGPAWRPDAGGQPFEVVPPAGWAIARNARAFGNRELVLRSPDGKASLSVLWVREDATSREVPLDLVAETRALGLGRAAGFATTLHDTRWIALDGRPAVAVTGATRWARGDGPGGVHDARQEGEVSLVAAREDGHVLFLVMAAPGGALDGYLPEIATLLEGLRFPTREAPAPPSLDVP
jgi:hypothetical protein